MKPYRTRRPGPDGWTRWSAIDARHYIGCCDCGLVHQVRARAVKGGRTIRGAIVQYRVRRAEGQTRRLRKPKGRK